ncbi:hypothetical protein YC2023_033680 [Brassica napus]
MDLSNHPFGGIGMYESAHSDTGRASDKAFYKNNLILGEVCTFQHCTLRSLREGFAPASTRSSLFFSFAETKKPKEETKQVQAGAIEGRRRQRRFTILSDYGKIHPRIRWKSRQSCEEEEGGKRRLRKEAKEWSGRGWRPELESFRSPVAREKWWWF